MMLSIIVSILLAFRVQARELIAKQSSTLQNSTSNFIDQSVQKVVGNLVGRMKEWHMQEGALDNTVLQKGSGHLTLTRPSPAALRSGTTASFRQQTVSSSTSHVVTPSLASRQGMKRHLCQASRATAAPPAFDAQRSQELVELGQDLVATALRNGPKAAFRTAQALDAAICVARDVAGEVSSRAAANPAAATDAASVSRLLPSVPNVLRRFCENLGATYIKLGQFVASAPTIFPQDFVEEFQKCLDQAPPVPFRDVRRIVESEMGQPLSATFSEFDEAPIASASVAVVHRAVLKENGQEVAVKVLRPGIGDTLSVDLDFIKSGARILQFLQPELKRLSLADIAADIQTSMLEEVDLRKELKNLKAFRAYLEMTGAMGVTAPLPFEKYCSERVLVSEFLRGVPLTDLDAVRRITTSVKGAAVKARVAQDPEEVLINALNAWLGSVFLAESFHADVHAGNLLALPNGDVAFIDFGIVGRVAPTTWGALQALFRSFGSKVTTADPMRPSTAIDYDGMARALVAIGATDVGAAERVDIASFAADLQELFESIDELDPTVTVAQGYSQDGDVGTAASLTVDEAALTRAVSNLAVVGDRYGLKFPREFGLLVKQALYFDRYTKILAPGLQVGADPRIRDVPDGGAEDGASSTGVYSTTR